MNKRNVFAILLLSIILSCNSQTNNLQSAKELFVKNKLNGTFVLYDLSSEKIKIYNEARGDSAFIPASTFKILNSLIALENNVIANENEIIKWDGKDKGWEKWNKDQNMQTAISFSCIWFYQELASRIGKERMQQGISTSSYGNEKMGAKIDNFWLKGDLRISAKEQVNFIEKLIKNQLPFTKENQAIVKRIIITDTISNCIIHSKTGWGNKVNPKIAWLVGYAEKGNKKFIFALNFEVKNKADLSHRKKILYSVLRNEGII